MVHFENRTTYLFVEYSGLYSFSTTVTVLQQTAENCKQQGLHKVLLDARGLYGHISVFDRFNLGMEGVKQFGTSIRVAVVAERSLINNVMENVMVNRLAKVKAFTDFDEALRWLGVEPSSSLL